LERRREWGEKVVRNMGREVEVPKRRVRRARVRSVGAGIGGLVDPGRSGWWREWKRALPVPRGRRTIVGRTNLLWDASVGCYIECEIMNELVDIPRARRCLSFQICGPKKPQSMEITI
jgi:hypothetical protein